MSDHLFRLLERLQKLDDQLRRAQRLPIRQDSDRQEIARLTLMKSALRHRLTRLSARPARMPAH